MLTSAVFKGAVARVGPRLGFIGAEACSHRQFSSLEEIKENEAKVQRHKAFVQKTTSPKTLTDVLGSGTELHVPEDMTEIQALTGMPKEQQNRTVLIAPRQLKTLQSGDSQSYQWQLTWKNGNRWNNPLMGWSSTNDPQAQVKLSFDSEADAVAYAKKNGWKYELRGKHAEANENIEVGTMSYAHNFLTAKTTAVIAEEGKKTKEYTHSGKHASNWFQPLTYDGDAEVRQHGPKATH